MFNVYIKFLIWNRAIVWITRIIDFVCENGFLIDHALSLIRWAYGVGLGLCSHFLVLVAILRQMCTFWFWAFSRPARFHIVIPSTKIPGSDWLKIDIIHSLSLIVSDHVTGHMKIHDRDNFYLHVTSHVKVAMIQIVNLHVTLVTWSNDHVYRHVSCRFQCTALAAISNAGFYLSFFFILNVVYLPIYAQKKGLAVGMTKQISNCKEIDILNFLNHQK